ncbi:HAD family hydrolase [Thalassotalea euphylliae]|uniref:HAD family hydrolase n=1 Tax=Thalassotalea euphylliae TaxID=1655234 RepID=UPI0036400DEE
MTRSSHTYKGVLFDLDGTLLDTADDLGHALNYVLEKHGLAAVERERYLPVASDGAKGLLELGFSEQLAQYDYEALRKEFLCFYEDNIATHTRPYDGVIELLKTLDDKNINWGIVTNKPIGLTEKLLPNYTCFDSAKAVLGGDSLNTRKPHPEPLIVAANNADIIAEQCVYVGDAPRDIQAGNAANMLSLVAAWGYIPESEELSTWLADEIIAHPMDVLRYLSN